MSTIVLCGMPLSNYHNKVKQALLEKGLPFEERYVATKSDDPNVLAASPLAKIPYLLIDGRPLCESSVMLEWIEAAHPNPPLLPADPYEAAKVRELMTFLDLHLELVARDLYAKAFFGGTISDSNAERVKKVLTKNIAGFVSLAKFAPFVAGAEFTLADCAAFQHLPLVGLATRIVYGSDLLAEGGVDWKAYTKRVGERPSAQRVAADRKAAQDAMKPKA
jgi:glutathione S-transferase